MPASTVVNGTKTHLPSAKSAHRSKKTRVVRRRGRGLAGSDDEIEREARSDSDTDDQSSLDSESDSDTASDDENHAGIVTPSTTQSPPPLDINGASSSVKPEAIVNGASGPFVGSTDWAQIVADETATGAGELPVIDFADMHSQAIPEPPRAAPRARKAQKQGKKASTTARPAPERAPSPPPVNDEEPLHPAEEPEASTSRAESNEPPLPRLRSQSARQAYQERLQQDPAFVPRVGEFWGHDDRLLDKDLRSLSGWWRGRWHNRGRGRGAFNMRGRGGRGFAPGRVPPQEEQEGAEEEQAVTEEVPPIERAWTHDGFEEMKRREDQRKEDLRRAQSQQQTPAPQKGAPFRGRGGFIPGRGRGGFARGMSPSGVTGAQSSQPHDDPTTKRTWFTMKPEKVWTKHAEYFLYQDIALRPRPGQGPGVRVKLPGRPAQVLRAQKLAHAPAASMDSTVSAASTEDMDRQFVVRIPPRVAAQRLATPATSTTDEAVTATSAVDTELSIEEVFTVRPHAAPSHMPINIPATNPDASQAVPVQVTETSAAPGLSPSQDISGLPDADTQRQLEELGMGRTTVTRSNDAPSVSIQETLLRNPPNPEVIAPMPQPPVDQSRPVPPALHPLQTSFSPVPTATSPPYGSPYAYGPALPPGVAMHPQGYPYEIATGRPVYLQPAAPPPMYTPRPMMHPYMGHPATATPFVPGHMHHPSQEYIQHPHTPPVNGFIDPATGVPIFAPARQNSRIEIRAPSDRSDGKPVKPAPRPSGLRTAVSEVDTTTAEGDVAEDAAESQQQLPPQHATPDPAVMAYAPYPQQYYYPDPNAYSAYMDMSPQVMHYDLYPQHDQRAHQPIIYY